MMQTIRRVGKSLFGDGHFKEPLLNVEELQMSKQISTLYMSVTEECGVDFTAMHIMLSQEKFPKMANEFEMLDKYNQYLQGMNQDSLPYKITQQLSQIYKTFKDIEKVENNDLRMYFLKKVKDENEISEILGLNFSDYLLNIYEDDGDNTQLNTSLQVAKLCLLLLFRAQKSRYQSIIIPEFEVGQIKEMVHQALQEFKKTTKNCDGAFKQLIASLDTFTDNFDSYYEQFQLNGKEPSVLFVNFIEDVQKQYEGTDTKEGKRLLMQFKRIQQEFGKRLGSQIDNPQIQALYKQLEKQIEKASKVLNIDDQDE